MRGFFGLALIASAVCCGPIAAVAAPITGELNLTGSGGVSFGSTAKNTPANMKPGVAPMAVFTALGKGDVSDPSINTGSFSELVACSKCVTFGTTAGAPSGDTQYTYGPVLSTSVSGNDTTYTHGPASGLPLFALSETINGMTVTSSFTPVGTVDIDKIVGKKGTSYTLTATGTLMLTGFDPTQGLFMITTQGSNMFASFSATADAAPAPLAGAGLLSFGGAGIVALRRRGRRLLERFSSRFAVA